MARSTLRARGNARPGSGARPAPPTPGSRLAWRAAAVVTLAGVGVSGYLLATALRGVSPLCLVGTSCGEVASSPYARFLGLPTAAWGLLLYVTTGGVAAAGAWRRTVPLLGPLALLGLGAFGATFSGYLMWLQLTVIHALCIWCATSAALWVALLALAVWVVRSTA